MNDMTLNRALQEVSSEQQLQKLRIPFAENQISYLPKGGVKLAYVGHAALTDRLLDVDPNWTWEPLSCGPDGLPQLDSIGGLWIKLTVCGVTRLGYGDAGDKKGCNAMKERIGDALRNAAMRFGAALDLWHKGDLHGDYYEDVNPRTGEITRAVHQEPAGNFYPQDRFMQNLPQWTQLIQSGDKPASRVIAMVESKGLPMSNAQKQTLNSIAH